MRPWCNKAVLVWVGLSCGVTACATPTPETDLSWSIGFACSADGTRAQQVAVRITTGDCPAEGPVVYEVGINKGGGAPPSAPGDLPGGSYAFSAIALDDKGALVAEACVPVTLPTSSTVKLMLEGSGRCLTPAATTDWPDTEGAPDAGMNAGGADTGADSGLVDASLLVEESGPRLEVDDLEIWPGTSIEVRYLDVKKPGKPFLGLYRDGNATAAATFAITFPPKQSVTSGSHAFNNLQPGPYTVRLVYDTTRIVDEVDVEIWADTDGDGTPDPMDGCKDDPSKVAPLVCGCGSAETDGDGDGSPDCVDLCPTDRLKLEPGVCGCNMLESFFDQDSDGISDCYDACPGDSGKTKPLQCGCGQPETDTDKDQTADCVDECDDDPLKTELGLCGCGVPETDRDGDTLPDCLDQCADDPSKTVPGTCGCGTADTDSDGDGTPNCHDTCPNDKDKVAPGVCGCGVSDADTDLDGTLDCNDACPMDKRKIEPGLCGCGTRDNDSDADGTLDCFESCPLDPLKLEPLVCGCGITETDTDADGALDCNDVCDTDPLKTTTDQCGCGLADTDTDGDKTADCVDLCAADPAKTAPGTCGCGKREPFDVTGYKDAKGYSCSGWKGYDCAQAVEKYKYTQAQENSILANCSKTCGVCPP
jgi:hypothetical protein